MWGQNDLASNQKSKEYASSIINLASSLEGESHEVTIESAKLRVVHALLPYVSRVLLALVPHVPRALSALVPQLSRVLLARVLHVLVPHVLLCLTCLCCTCSHASRTLYVTYSIAKLYDMQLLLMEWYHNGVFLIYDISLQDPLIYVNFATLIHQPAFIRKLAL